ncbi:Ubiquitin-activating enzyme E1-like [Nakaseomyces glabratus]|uniref:Ubiquitin-activating enzyme E1-like n=1 Tax=Candida glabrata TaxID=5478 RepID=A0A0W0CZ21_CANGB|nr:ThiF family [Nakaseomyces glabratus]KAH7579345.1 ThiF family [Nakaseomyces glabratus]KAH7579972.1 ThiF family [Nakaseomyces glabratus]KAH7592526.1 ThiF family [Nakaseomyces glabratus]KAH7610371.1 ThiF family [Nakaseomyces glabratus]
MAVRESNLVKILGDEGYQKLRSTKCLLVGAGGIGSELLKDLVLMEVGEIHVVDLDTIDLSNLNRQFLFRQKDIKKPKSAIAVNAVQSFSNSKLIPYQDNIMDTNVFPLHWFQQFDIIFNALDNLAARRYVNKMTQFLSIPLLESGTSGFDGYIQPIIPGKTECFDCTKKETPKTFPVCTIRSTPSLPVHCIVWAKNFLFGQLFSSSANDIANEQMNEQDWGTDDVEEINRIKNETNELKELQNIIISGDKSRIRDIISKLFIQDIEKLLLIENLWKTRAKPVALTPKQLQESEQLGDVNHLNLNEIWDLETQIAKFTQITSKLMDRYNTESAIDFDKDDQDTLEFVATAANIRAHIFHIPVKSVFDIKQIAGNIIPAIATTNAIIAGLSSLMSLRVLNLLKYAKVDKPTDINMAFTAKASNLAQNRYLSNPKLVSPNKKCAVCSKVIRGVFKVTKNQMEKHSFMDFINALTSTSKLSDDISILDATTQRLLYDYDFEDLAEKKLVDLSLKNGSVLLITDEEEEAGLTKQIMEYYIEISDESEDKIEQLSLPQIIPQFSIPSETADENGGGDMLQNDSLMTSNDQTTPIVVSESDAVENGNNKRPLTEELEYQSIKSRKLNPIEDDDELVILD